MAEINLLAPVLSDTGSQWNRLSQLFAYLGLHLSPAPSNLPVNQLPFTQMHKDNVWDDVIQHVKPKISLMTVP